MASRDGSGPERGPSRPTGTGGPPDAVRRALRRGGGPVSPDAVRQLEDAFAPARRPGRQRDENVEFDYDDVVQQSFPASDPPPPPGA